MKKIKQEMLSSQLLSQRENREKTSDLICNVDTFFSQRRISHKKSKNYESLPALTKIALDALSDTESDHQTFRKVSMSRD